MARECIELDEQALAGAAELYGTSTSQETVEAALRDASQRQRRLAAFDRLCAMADAGDFDPLLDKANYRP